MSRSLRTSSADPSSVLSALTPMNIGQSVGAEPGSHSRWASAKRALRTVLLEQRMSTAQVGGAGLVWHCLPLIRRKPPRACHCVTADLAAAGSRMSQTGKAALPSVPEMDTNEIAQGCATALATASRTQVPGNVGSSKTRRTSLSTSAAETLHSSSLAPPSAKPCLATLLGKCSGPLPTECRLCVGSPRPTAARRPGTSWELTPSKSTPTLFAHTRNDGKPRDMPLRSSRMMTGMAF